MLRAATFLAAALWLGAAKAHLGCFAPGMYCLNGPQTAQDLNSNGIVTPLWDLDQSDWWFHHVNGCDEFPPADGDILELPAGGSFTVEIASNRAKTTLSYNGQDTSEWPDGNTYPEDYNVPTCIISPNMHTQNQSMAAGTAFAISYQSDITQVTPENLVVFSVRYNTPWKRVTVYDVPAALPACPPGGCICAWGWVPNGCGEPNMYHTGFKCQVTGATSTTPLGTPQPPVWCEGNPDGCTKGAKQMLYWNQASGNNIAVSGYDLEGSHKSPAYNSKCGFADGAQNDIFSGAPSSSSPSASSSPAGSSAGSSSSGSSSAAAAASSGSGSSGGSGSTGSDAGVTPAGATPAASTPSAAGGSPASSPDEPSTGTPNPAPSCKKRSSKRRRAANATSLVKKSSLVAAHRRHHARQTF